LAASSASRLGGGGRAATRLHGEQSRMDDLDGRNVAWRHDHPHAQLASCRTGVGEVVGHPDTAMTTLGFPAEGHRGAQCPTK